MAFLNLHAWAIIVEIDGELFAQKILRRGFFFIGRSLIEERNVNTADYTKCILCRCEDTLVPVAITKHTSNQCYLVSATDGDCGSQIYGGIYLMTAGRNESYKIPATTNNINIKSTEYAFSSILGTIGKNCIPIENDYKYLAGEKVKAKKFFSRLEVITDDPIYLIDDEGYLFSAGNNNILGRPLKTNVLQNRLFEPVSESIKFIDMAQPFASNKTGLAGAITTNKRLLAWGQSQTLLNVSSITPVDCGFDNVKKAELSDNRQFILQDNGIGTLFIENESLQFPYLIKDFTCAIGNYTSVTYIGFDGKLYQSLLHYSFTEFKTIFTNPILIETPGKIKKMVSYLADLSYRQSIVLQLEDNRVFAIKEFGIGFTFEDTDMKVEPILDASGKQFYAEDIGSYLSIYYAKGTDKVMYTFGIRPDTIFYSYGPEQYGGFDIAPNFPKNQSVALNPYRIGSWIPMRMASRIWPDELVQNQGLYNYWIES